MKSLLKNFFTAFVSKVLLILFGVIAQKFVLTSYGSSVNGLTSSLTQFLSYYTLLEAGLSLASIQALYAPLANKNNSIINKILSSTALQYNKIGAISLVVTLIISISMPFVSKSDLDFSVIFLVSFLMGSASALNYFLIGKYHALLYADRKTYIIHFLDSFLGILFSIIRIILINLGFSIVIVLLVALLSPIVRFVILFQYFRKKYSCVRFNSEPDNTLISKRKYVLFHQIVGMVTYHTDVIILTFFSTLNSVSVYSVYNLIYGNISNVISNCFSSALQPSFGRLAGIKDKNLNRYYLLYESLYIAFLFFFLTVVYLMTISFISLYTKGVVDVDYVDPILALLFMLSTLFNVIRIPPILMINCFGCFKETQIGAAIEMVINLSISIPAFYFVGMRGLLIGTCLAMLYRAIDVQIFAYKKLFHIKIASWFVHVFYNTLIMVGLIVLSHFYSLFTPDNWFSWIWSVFLHLILVFVLFFLLNLIAFRKDFVLLYQIIKQTFAVKSQNHLVSD